MSYLTCGKKRTYIPECLSLRFISEFCCSLVFVGLTLTDPSPSETSAVRNFICICEITGVDKWKTGLWPSAVPCIISHAVSGALRKANGLPATGWKIHYSDWWITVALWSHFLVDTFALSRNTFIQIHGYFLLHLKNIKSNFWFTLCLTRRWICTEPTSKINLAWPSVIELMMRMRLGFTLVR